MSITMLIQEHDEQNAIYQRNKAELFTQPDITNPNWIVLAGDRLDLLVQSLTSFCGEIVSSLSSYVETVDGLVSLFDDVILECSLLLNRREEIEEKILDLVKTAIVAPTLEDGRDRGGEHIVTVLIDGLLMSDVPLILRSTTMTAAIIDDTNPLRLGLTYYRIFCEKYPEVADSPALEYLKTEEEAHFLLLSGQNAAAAEAINRLFDSPVKSPEAYLLIALNSFYSGLDKDAIRSLEIGLEAFPGNLRLISARDGLLGD